MQTKQFHVIPNTLFPCLPTPSPTSRPLMEKLTLRYKWGHQFIKLEIIFVLEIKNNNNTELGTYQMSIYMKQGPKGRLHQYQLTLIVN